MRHIGFFGDLGDKLHELGTMLGDALRCALYALVVVLLCKLAALSLLASCVLLIIIVCSCITHLYLEGEAYVIKLIQTVSWESPTITLAVFVAYFFWPSLWLIALAAALRLALPKLMSFFGLVRVLSVGAFGPR